MLWPWEGSTSGFGCTCLSLWQSGMWPGGFVGPGAGWCTGLQCWPFLEPFPQFSWPSSDHKPPHFLSVRLAAAGMSVFVGALGPPMDRHTSQGQGSILWTE